MKTIAHGAALSAWAIILAGCSGSSPDEPVPNPPVPGDKTPKEIKINARMDGTRAGDQGFDNGDAVGLFVSNYTGGGATTLKDSGNHADNARFAYDGTWKADKAVYWKDDDTHADFYLYYPYDSALKSVTSYTFNIKADQTTASSYSASDFMAGKTADVAPGTAAVDITVKHLMSQVRVKLAAGDGFTAEELTNANPTVTLNGFAVQATVNLTDRTAAASGNATDIKPLADGTLAFKALVAPQNIEKRKLITVRVGERDFVLDSAINLQGGKSHNITVTLSKAQNGINVSISPWETSEEDFGGVAM